MSNMLIFWGNNDKNILPNIATEMSTNKIRLCGKIFTDNIIPIKNNKNM